MAARGKSYSRNRLTALQTLGRLAFDSADPNDPISPFDFVNQSVARNDLPEDAVHAIEPKIIFKVDEKLTVAGIRHWAGESHPDAVLHVSQIVDLVGDLFARSSAAKIFSAPHFTRILFCPFDRNLFGARVAALKNKVVYFTMKEHFVVKAGIDQIEKMSDQLGGLVRSQLHNKAASAFHLKLHLGTFGWGGKGESKRKSSHSDHALQCELIVF